MTSANGTSTRSSNNGVLHSRTNGYAAIPDASVSKHAATTSPILPTSPVMAQIVTTLRLRNQHARELFAEFFGTLVLLCVGLGACHQVSITNNMLGTYVSINMAWGIGCMLATHCSGAISGADFNPAVTIARAVYKLLPWWKVPGYIAAQMVGAFVASFLIYIMHRDSIDALDPMRTTGYKNFVTGPYAHVTMKTAVYTEFFATAVLCIGIFALTDKKNRGVKPTEAPLRMMLLMWSIGMAFGMNTGFAMNPARDFAPRLFTCLAGWGWQVFTVNHYYFWVPIVAPVFGAIAGVAIYKVMIEMHIPTEEEVEDERIEKEMAAVY